MSANMFFRAEFYRDGRREIANVEDGEGFYVCDTERCSGESRTAFERRVRSLIDVLQRSETLVTTNPKTRKR